MLAVNSRSMYARGGYQGGFLQVGTFNVDLRSNDSVSGRWADHYHVTVTAADASS